MIIKNMSEFQSFFNGLNLVKIFGETPEYHLIQSNDKKWAIDLNQSLFNSAPRQICIIGLLVTPEADENCIKTLILILRPDELKSPYIAHLNNFINNITAEDNIISFLKSLWEKNAFQYPFTFLWTTKVNQNFTHISDRAVAPAYQNNGLMKRVSLALIEKLQTLYFEEHNITAVTIHPATYLFFSPWDKNFEGYRLGEVQETGCGALLRYHTPEPQSTQTLASFDLTQAMKIGLLQNSLLICSIKTKRDGLDRENRYGQFII